jgi:hypothetical protein
LEAAWDGENWRRSRCRSRRDGGETGSRKGRDGDDDGQEMEMKMGKWEGEYKGEKGWYQTVQDGHKVKGTLHILSRRLGRSLDREERRRSWWNLCTLHSALCKEKWIHCGHSAASCTTRESAEKKDR